MLKTKSASHQDIVKAFRKEGNPEIAEHSSRFFKTGKDEYGEGDTFLGIRVPVTRKFAGKYRDASLAVVCKLLTSKFHEERLLAVIMLADKFKRGEVNVIVVSKVANFAINLPDASVAIQVSGTFGSRQEEAQRLGRILRPKEKDSFFYSVVTRESKELDFAMNRQLFLAEQGYPYEIEYR